MCVRAVRCGVMDRYPCALSPVCCRRQCLHVSFPPHCLHRLRLRPCLNTEYTSAPHPIRPLPPRHWPALTHIDSNRQTQTRNVRVSDLSTTLSPSAPGGGDGTPLVPDIPLGSAHCRSLYVLTRSLHARVCVCVFMYVCTHVSM